MEHQEQAKPYRRQKADTWLPRAGARVTCLAGKGLPFGVMEHVFELDSGDGHVTL